MQSVIKTSIGSLLDLAHVFKERLLAVLAFFSLGLIAIAALNFVMPPADDPNLGQLGKRIEFFSEAFEDYNVLLVGTSRTYRGIDPVILQRVAKENGCDVRAFNLGIPKLRLTELRHLQDHLSAEMLKGFDLILLSPMALSKIRIENWASKRIQHFSDWRGYRESLADIWYSPLTNAVPKQIYYSTLLSGAFAYRQLGIGRLANSFRATTSSSADNPSGDFFDGSAIVDFSRHGYVALDDEPSEQFLKRGQIIKDNPDYFETLKARNIPVDDFRGPSAEMSWQRFEWAMEYFSVFDAPIGLFLPPLLTSRAQEMALAEMALARGLPVMNYNRLELYPELFEREHWFDYYHLGKSGAELFTQMIGEDICSLIETTKT